MALDTIITKWEIDIKDVKESLDSIDKKLTKTVKKSKESTALLSKQWKELGAVITGAFAVTAIIAGIQKVISLNAELSDSIADVRKTTGLTKEGVEALVTSLKKIDTRTSLKGLLEIAKIGGQLGVAKNEILGFTEAIDKAVVALGDEFGGGAEQVAATLGKIESVFNISKESGDDLGVSLTKIGSSINALGAAGLATAPFLTDFTQRLGGIAVSAGISATEIFGLAAAVEQSGLRVESSSTAISLLLQKFSTDTAKFAKLAGVGVEEFTELVNTDLNEALLLFLEGTKNSAKDTITFAKNLQSLGLEGAEVVKVVSTLSGKTDLIREKQALANLEFEKGTSLLEEFNLKNNTLAANFDKLFKKIAGAVTGSGLIDFFNTIVSTLVDVRSESEKLASEFSTLGNEIGRQEAELTPLIDRYDELKGQTELNEEEQEELRKVIEKIAQIVPTAATEIDAYGRVLDINTGQVLANTKTQKELQKILGEKAVEEARKEIEDLNESLARQVSIYDKIKDGIKEVQTISKLGTIRVSEVKVSNEAIRDQRQAILETKDAIASQLKVIESLNEELTDEEKLLKGNVGANESVIETNEKALDLTKLTIKELKKLKLIRADLADQIEAEIKSRKTIVVIDEKAAKKARKQAEKLAKERAARRKKNQSEDRKFDQDMRKAQLDAVELSLKAIEDQTERELALLSFSEDRKIEALRKQRDQGLLSQQEFEDARGDIQILTAREIDSILEDQAKKSQEEKVKSQEEADEKEIDAEKKKAELIKQIREDLVKASIDLLSIFINAQIAAIEREQEEISNQAILAEESETERVDALLENESLTEDQRAAIKKQSEENIQKIREDAEEKQKTLQAKRLKRERLAGLFEIAVNQAIAISELVKNSLKLTNPFAIAAAFAAGLALIISGISQAQGVINSTRIPEFAEGGLISGDKKIIQVNEKGEEFMVNAKDTAKHLPVLEAMNAGNFDDYIVKTRVMPMMNEANKRMKKKEGQFMAESFANSFVNNSDFDDTNMLHEMRKFNYNIKKYSTMTAEAVKEGQKDAMLKRQRTW